ncbi:hypothetical protein D3C72_1883080 [compost metagenome]
MAHDAQIVSIALHLAKLAAQGVDVVFVAEADHPVLQLFFLHDAYPAGDNPDMVEATDLVMGVMP